MAEHKKILAFDSPVKIATPPLLCKKLRRPVCWSSMTVVRQPKPIPIKMNNPNESKEISIDLTNDDNPKSPEIDDSDEEVEIVEVKKRRLVKKKHVSENVDPSSENTIENVVDSRELELLNYLNLAGPSEIAELISISENGAAKLILSRPFDSIYSLIIQISAVSRRVQTLESLHGKYEDMINKDRSLNQVISTCEKLGRNISEELMKFNVRRVNPIDESESLEKYGELCTFSSPKSLCSNMTLKGYQRIGVSWLISLYTTKTGGILADEMGLGKTAQIIGMIAHIKEKIPDHRPHLIIVPSSILENWSREFEAWCPSLKVLLYKGSQAERTELRYELVQDVPDVIITTYNLATSNEDRVFLKKIKPRSLFLDEGHLIKNSNSARFRNLASLKVEFRLIITGTPIQNDLTELMSILSFILPDVFNPHSVKDYFKSDSEDRILRIRQLLSPFILRRSKSNVMAELPKKNVLVKYCDLSDRQKETYVSIRAQKKNNGDLKNLQNVLMELRKCANHLLLSSGLYESQFEHLAALLKKQEGYRHEKIQHLIEDFTHMSDYEIHKLCLTYPSMNKYSLADELIFESGKIRLLKEILPEMISKGDKILIFSQFLLQLDILEDFLDRMGIAFLRMDGQTEVVSRQDIIDSFHDTYDIAVFLLSTKSGGVGLNLTCANIVILYDMDFNPHNDLQAENRAHRVGQKRDVTVIRLVTRNTIEEKILEIGEKKLLLDEKLKTNSEASIEKEIISYLNSN